MAWFAPVGPRFLCGACEPVGQHGAEGCHGNRGLLPSSTSVRLLIFLPFPGRTPGHHADWPLFHVRYTLRGTSYLLHRIGYSPQVPVHRAAERDEDAITAWRAVTWAKVRG